MEKRDVPWTDERADFESASDDLRRWQEQLDERERFLARDRAALDGRAEWLEQRGVRVIARETARTLARLAAVAAVGVVVIGGAAWAMAHFARVWIRALRA